MYGFSFHRPKSLAEAADVFARADDPTYVSGGHSLLPTMKSRLAAPSDLIALTHLPELQGITRDGDRVIIGAAQTHASVASAALVQDALPALAQLAGSIGDMQVRHRGTIGGSLANNDPAADYPSAVLALGATIVTSTREIHADDYFDGMFATALELGEIITAIAFPIPKSAGYAKMRNPASRYALAASFVAKTEDAVRVAITGAGSDGVFRWSAAEKALGASFDSAALAGLALSADDMLGDMHADASYRAHLAAICTQRAVDNQGRLTLL
ncbi:xanthine dehydrogenase family protein subunit M [Cognatishimia sp. F0-27]|uniref:FAD binding domain-containing protein n=1 Tax=Cognatishimia sp. F0-27 TaxID=2816855 RepID=UPI001D0C28C8|nr:xanthine dehydrogenase family protein subunit M [Cognatishimia sp. F0-27]MCC1494548.1 xanthine dehydrogenase family protein subunit M [Cognatishimia sp. F0-27]